MTPRARIHAIIAGVATWHGVALQDILGKSRRGQVISARHRAIKAVAEAMPKLSGVQLGRIFGVHNTAIGYALGRHARCKPRWSRGRHPCDRTGIWTPAEDDALRAALWAGDGSATAAAATGRTAKACQGRARRLGTPFPRRRKRRDH